MPIALALRNKCLKSSVKEHFSKARKYICVSVNKDKDNVLVELAVAVTAFCLGHGLGEELEMIYY